MKISLDSEVIEVLIIKIKIEVCPLILLAF